jgi:hypothetical protein
MGALETRVRRLEERTPGSPAPHPHGQAAKEIRAIDAEIRAIDKELEAIGESPDGWVCSEGGDERLEGLTLDEKIRALEEEIAREEASDE